MKRHVLSYLLIGLCLLTQVGWAQVRTPSVTGVVRDNERKEGLPGVSVVVIGSATGTTTDGNGKFTLNNLPANARLRFSFIGYKPMDMAVNNQAQVDIVMTSDDQNLDEVVVVGYGEVRKSDLTGAVGTLRQEEIKRALPVNITDALASRVAGAQIISNDGAPGGGVTMLIRGGNGISGANQPLVVIDGFPFVPSNDNSFNPLAQLNPNDIENIEVLKDASATAIYGAAGGNGVIIITTKKGQSGKPKINLNYFYGQAWLPFSNRPKIMNAQQYIDFNIDRFDGSLSNIDPNSATYRNIWKARKEQGWADTKATDWFKEVSQVAERHSFAADFSGGTDASNYAASIGYNKEEGTIINSGFDRITTKLNLNQKFGKKLSASLGLNYSKTLYKGLIQGGSGEGVVVQALTMNPFISRDDIYGEDWNAIRDASQDNQSFYGQENPINYLNKLKYRKNNDWLFGNLQINYNILPGLNFRTSFGGTLETQREDRFLPSTTRQARSVRGIIDNNRYESFKWVYQAQLNYSRTFAQKHRISADAVFEMKRNTFDNTTLRTTNLTDESLGYYGSGFTSLPAPTNRTWVADAMASYLGRVNYDYGDRYLVTLSFRTDGSSRFGVNNRWGSFPSAAVAWKISNESFMKNIRNVSLLKLRGSYGVTGNNQLENYLALGLLNNSFYTLDNSPVLAKNVLRLPNPDLKWETTTQYNAGIDVGLFGNRLNFSLDVYSKNTKDLLLNINLPYTTGYDRATINYGAINNKGIELTLNSVNVQRNGFRWSTNFNIAANRNKVISLGDRDEDFLDRVSGGWGDLRLRVGDPVTTLYGFVQSGVYNTEIERNNTNQGAPTFAYVTGGTPSNATGQIRIIDINGDGLVDFNDKIPIANLNPLHTGGIGNTFEYKNFDLYVFGRWSYGNDIVNYNWLPVDPERNVPYSNLYQNVWTPLTPDRNYRGAGSWNSRSYHLRSEYIEDGSYFRLDNVSLGYRLPARLFGNAKISNARIFINGQNLYVFHRYTWWDPEVNSGGGREAALAPGVDRGSYPRSRSLRAGINLTF